MTRKPSLTPVDPVLPVAPWLGGKRNLAKVITPIIAATPQTTYAEPFGGKVSGRNFGVSKDRSARFNLTELEPMLEELHSRLSGVVIECLDYADFIARYDGPGTLFYLDPPYWGSEADYGKGMFSSVEFERMAAQLADIKGRFLLSINDTPEVRRIFSGFDLKEVSTSYTIGTKAGSRGQRGELLVGNIQFESRAVEGCQVPDKGVLG